MFDLGRWTRKDHERLNCLLRSPRSTVKSVAHLHSKPFCVSIVCAEGRTAELGQSRCTGSKLTQLPTVMQPLCCCTSFGMGGAAADGADGTDGTFETCADADDPVPSSAFSVEGNLDPHRPKEGLRSA